MIYIEHTINEYLTTNPLILVIVGDAYYTGTPGYACLNAIVKVIPDMWVVLGIKRLSQLEFDVLAGMVMRRIESGYSDILDKSVTV